MTLFQALRHFAAEAFRNMWRSWKVSLLAIVVTAVSLFLGGSLFLFGSNLARALAGWESEARLVVYMEPGASAEAVSNPSCPMITGIGGRRQSNASVGLCGTL